MRDEEKALLRVPRRASSSRGTAPRRSRSPTATLIGAMLDRNGLRPAKYVVTNDGLVVLASEFGVLADRPRATSSRRGACSRARCSSSTPTQRPHRLPTTRSSTRSRRRSRTASGSTRTRSTLSTLPEACRASYTRVPTTSCARLQQAFGYTEEDLKIDPRADGRRRRRAGRLDGRRHPARGAVASARSCSSATSSSSSRRSPTRRSIRSAKRSSCRS